MTTAARVARCVTAGVLAAGLAWATPPINAIADNPLPSIPPYIPDVPYPYPGSYLYPYNLIPVYGPAINDARGVRAAGTADPTMTAEGMPGSELGPAANKSNILGTYSSMKNNISAGPAPAQIVQPGISPGAGNQMPVVEDPRGLPPGNEPSSESTQPTGTPAVPGNAQVLESPTGQPPTSSPTPAPAPPAVQVWPQTPGFAPGAFGTGSGPGISAGQ
ncbi:MAG: hypothetical protein U0R66_15795 [Mycobacterium sp.]